MTGLQAAYSSARSAIEVYFEPLFWVRRSIHALFERGRRFWRSVSYVYGLRGHRFGSKQSSLGSGLSKVNIVLGDQLPTTVFSRWLSTSVESRQLKVIEELLRHSLIRLAKAGNRSDSVLISLDLATVYAQQENFLRAEHIARKAVDTASEIGDEVLLVLTFVTLAWIYQRTDETGKAIEYYRRALDYQKPETADTLATAYSNLAIIYQQQNRLDLARDFLTKAIEKDRLRGEGDQLIRDYTRLAIIFQLTGEIDMAHDTLRKAEELWQKRGPRQSQLASPILPDE